MTKTLVYQMYPISWENISAMTRHLERVAELGTNYVWLSPMYPSPRYDHGYDVADFLSIDSRFGTMDDFDEFVKVAHELDMGVLMDLTLNHTSTEHAWFKTHPEFYCWSKHDRPGWWNLFDNGPAWEYNAERDSFYLHLFHKNQADLNWFPDGPEGDINRALLSKFYTIVDYWTWGKHSIDGFRLDIPQAINKDLMADELTLDDLMFGDLGARVINEVFKGSLAFLIMECFDPIAGPLIDYYSRESMINFVMNVCLKDEIDPEKISGDEALKLIRGLTKNSHFMLDLESHDSPRLPSRGVEPETGIRWMFDTGAQGVCLYQGQELGLNNPSIELLPDELMLSLDAQTMMKYDAGESLDTLRPTSRANARVPLPLDEYAKQEKDPDSYLNTTKKWLKYWRTA